MPVTSVTISIPVRDLETACQWYQQVLDKPYDIEPVPGIREFEVGGVWVQLSEDRGPGGDWALRIGVGDLGSERRRLERLGLELEDTRTVPGVISFFDFRDLDGNWLSFYQVHKPEST